MKRFLASIVAAIVVFFAVTASAQSKPPLRLLETIPLPDLKAGDSTILPSISQATGCF